MIIVEQESFEFSLQYFYVPYQGQNTKHFFRVVDHTKSNSTTLEKRSTQF